MNSFTTSAEHFLTIVGLIEAFVLVVGIGISLVLWGKGIAPVLYRLGNGLANRKIAIFAQGDNRASLKALLLGSGLFREKNMYEVGSVRDVGICEDASVY